MKTILAVLTVAFTSASFLHFAGRIFRNRARGMPRASAVSLALCFMVLGPIMTTALVRRVVPVELYSAIEWANFGIALALLLAILRVEQQDDQREQRRQAEDDAARMLEDYRARKLTPKGKP